MLVKCFGSSFQIDDVTLLIQVVHIVEEAGRSATTADDDVLKFCHLVQHVMFYLAEALFTFLGKDLRHRLVHTALDIPVQIVEHHARLFRESLAYGRLAGTHVANEDDASHFFCFSMISMHWSKVSFEAVGCKAFGMR